MAGNSSYEGEELRRRIGVLTGTGLERPIGRLSVLKGRGVAANAGIAVVALVVVLLPFARADNAVPRSVAPVSVFARLPFFQDLALSPDGSKMAFIAPINGRKHLLAKSLVEADAKYHALPPGDKSDIVWFRWANNERLIASYSATVRSRGNDFEETRLLSTSFDMKDLVWTVRPERDRDGVYYGQFQDRVVDWLPEEPDHILLALDLSRNSGYGVEKINIKTRQRTTIERPRGGIQHWLTDNQGIPRLAWGIDKNKVVMIYRAPDSADFVSLEKQSWFNDWNGIAGFDDDPSYAFVFSTVNGRNALVRLNLVSGEIVETVFAHDKYDVGSAITDESGRRVIGVRYTDDYPRSYYFDPLYKQIQEQIDRLLPATSNQIWQALPAENLFVISVQSDRQPLQFALLDRNKKTLDLIASSREKVDSKLMASMEPVEFVARDKTVIPGYLTLPRGKPATDLATVLLPHGGPHSRDTRSFNYLVQLLASRGYAVLQANFRGSSGYGKAWENAGKNQWGGLMQDDLTDAAQWVIDEGIADPDRICIVGWSYGGYAALMAGVNTPELFHCAASINGVADIPDMIDNNRGFVGGQFMTRNMGLTGANNRDVSPHHQADKIGIPLFLAAARDDSVVPFEQSRDLFRKLKKRVPVTYVEVDLGGHSLDHEQGRKKILTGLAGFLDKHLGD